MKIKNISNFKDMTSEKVFGFTDDGQRVFLYNLENKNGMQLSLTPYGATLTSLRVPLKTGVLLDVVPGFETLQDYMDSFSLPVAPCFGATIGRYAGRIAKGKFVLDGREIKLNRNNNGNTLHGGFVGFSQKMWEVKKIQPAPNASITFSYVSADGEEHFPGKLTVELTYTLTEENEVVIEYKAFTTENTVVNLTHHSYFNLDGHTGRVTGQQLAVSSQKILETTSDNIPTGNFISLEGHKFDFSTPKPCPEKIDNTFVLDGQYGQTATLYSPQTKLKMAMFTNQPSVQIYVGGNCFNRLKGKENADYHAASGICFETQLFPDAPNHAQFPDATLKKDSIYYHKTIYKFQSL